MNFFCNVKTDDTPYYARDSFACFMVNTPFLVIIKSDIITSNDKHEVNMRYLFSTGLSTNRYMKRSFNSELISMESV